jgi:hypothetical protein
VNFSCKAEAALALGGIDRFKECAGQDVFEKDGITAERAADDESGSLPDRGLQTTLGGGKNDERKVGQERLFGHTFKPYPDRLSVY